MGHLSTSPGVWSSEQGLEPLHLPQFRPEPGLFLDAFPFPSSIFVRVWKITALWGIKLTRESESDLNKIV